MPATPWKNTLYRLALPFVSPSPSRQMATAARGRRLSRADAYHQLLCRHHVLGASLLLSDGSVSTTIDVSTVHAPVHRADEDTLYRVASITKMATSLVVLRLCAEGLLSLDAPVSLHLSIPADTPPLRGVTLRHLLSHSSGLRDIAVCDRALQEGLPFTEVLADPAIRQSEPGAIFAYCNFGFGLLGCIIEAVTSQSLETVFQERLFRPLGMCATLDGSTIDEKRIMPISRVLPYHPGQDVTVTPLGRKPLLTAEPLHHFGHTAGSLYTNADSLSRLLCLIAQQGAWEGHQLIPEALIREMTSRQASYGTISPTLHYGLGLLIIEDAALSSHRLLGHQGFAYGCADGAFFEESTGRQVIFLNGGASEARTGRLGLCNRDVLRWALRKELPSWM